MANPPIKHYRTAFYLRREKDGSYDADLAGLQQMVANLKYYGIESMITLRGSSPEWSHPGYKNLHRTGLSQAGEHKPTVEKYGALYPGPFYSQGAHWVYPPDDWQDYRDFVAALVNRLKGRVLVYEIFNEPVVANQDHPIGGYKALGEWVRHFSEVAKPVDPAADLIIGHADQMLPGLVADGIMRYVDGVAYHLYSGDLQQIRGVVESTGEMKQVWMSEYKAVYQELMTQVRGQTLWNAFSVSDWDYGNSAKILTLQDARGNWVNKPSLRGVGDRIVPVQNFSLYGDWTGKLPSADPAGQGAGRILAEVVLETPAMPRGNTQRVTLRATNNTNETFHNVRLWPVGFVDSLGFDLAAIRAADTTIAVLKPGDVQEITLEVTPGRSIPLASYSTTRGAAWALSQGGTLAEGVYMVGLAIVNDEGRHSLALKPLTVLPDSARQ